MDLCQITGKMCLIPCLDEFKCLGHHGKKRALHSHHLPPAATEWNVLAENSVMLQQTEPFHHCLEVILVDSMRFMFGKTSLALVFG